ncbi:hypothetical protein [Yoonia sediminilitoris]|uniref:Lipoprotein n=1 Tax=Yoonia sediminilitoris TaxID=1286148 RepID=A0A2T6KIF2_9RHOB|nr:hypothetical protein [Yoonia sediminilitoris]PUB15488.1 hypothetical protein C8N45_104108 [Yoonia sediminilitoris]RCW96098.1 hypothetical protein DFP92_104108 [Yoonia sediminilitoris]
MLRRQFLIGAPLALSACATQEVWAPDNVVSKAVYRGTGPKSLTLYTMLNVGSDNGAHSALLIDASQRVMFDPAGSWEQSRMPERNDVLFGVTPELEQYYVSFHARVTYYVVGHKIEVSPDVAEQAFKKALQVGPVAQANCTRFTSRLLRSLPGFADLPQTWFPDKLNTAFGQLPGVETRVYRENDADDKSIAAREIAAALRTEP